MHIGASVSPSFLPDQLQAIERYMEYAGRLRLTSIELDFSIQGHLPEFAALPYPWEETPIWDEVRRQVAYFALPGVHLPYMDINPLSNERKEAEQATFQYVRSIERAGDLGLRYGVIHMVGLRPGTTRETGLPLWVDYMGHMARHAEKAGIILCLENAAYGFYLHDAAYVIRQVNSPWLRMTLDIGHAHLKKSASSGLEGVPYAHYGSMEAFIDQEGELLYTLHIHDNHGAVDDHLVIGEGEGDFSYLKAIRRIGFSGAWTFEHNIFDDWETIGLSHRRLLEIVGEG